MDYKNAGVDIEAGYKSVELMKEHGRDRTGRLPGLLLRSSEGSREGDDGHDDGIARTDRRTGLPQPDASELGGGHTLLPGSEPRACRRAVGNLRNHTKSLALS